MQRVFPASCRACSPRPARCDHRCLAQAQAQAEERPYYVGVSQGFTHESNVFHSSSNEQSDTVSSTGVLGGLNLDLGRQHLYLKGAAQSNRHSGDLDLLNNVSYALSTGLDWQTIERLSGSFRYSTSQSLINYADFDIPAGTVKDLQRGQHFAATVRFGITPHLAATAGVQRDSVDYSADVDKRDSKGRATSVGLVWGGGGQLSLGLSLREGHRDMPTAQISPFVPGDPNAVPPTADIFPTYGPDHSDRRDVSVTAVWVPSGLSTLSARLSSTRETHSQVTIPKLTGVTGSLSWDYQPTGRFGLKTTVVRDIGTQSAFEDLPPDLLPTQPSNTSLNTTTSAVATYQVTGKIVANARLAHTEGGSTFVSGTSRNSTTDTIGLGLNWLATRTISVGCNIDQQHRSSAYTANVFGCVGQLTIP